MRKLTLCPGAPGVPASPAFPASPCIAKIFYLDYHMAWEMVVSFTNVFFYKDSYIYKGLITLKPFGPGRPIDPGGPLPPVEPAGPGPPSSPGTPCGEKFILKTIHTFIGFYCNRIRKTASRLLFLIFSHLSCIIDKSYHWTNCAKVVFSSFIWNDWHWKLECSRVQSVAITTSCLRCKPYKISQAYFLMNC